MRANARCERIPTMTSWYSKPVYIVCYINQTDHFLTTIVATNWRYIPRSSVSESNIARL